MRTHVCKASASSNWSIAAVGSQVELLKWIECSSQLLANVIVVEFGENSIRIKLVLIIYFITLESDFEALL
jgi:hypothetical protein